MIVVPPEAAAAMRWHARACAPNEACGLLAGVDGEVRMVYCLTNVDASPSRYTVDPAEHFGALRHAEAQGWDIIGVFHSHPDGPGTPSPADEAGALDPGWWYLIVNGAARRESQIRAFRIAAGVVTEARIYPSPKG